MEDPRHSTNSFESLRRCFGFCYCGNAFGAAAGGGCCCWAAVLAITKCRALLGSGRNAHTATSSFTWTPRSTSLVVSFCRIMVWQLESLLVSSMAITSSGDARGSSSPRIHAGGGGAASSSSSSFCGTAAGGTCAAAACNGTASMGSVAIGAAASMSMGSTVAGGGAGTASAVLPDALGEFPTAAALFEVVVVWGANWAASPELTDDGESDRKPGATSSLNLASDVVTVADDCTFVSLSSTHDSA
uniref:Uncharacterized protein n=1 Tax=Oryza meridionalis TaxID=40149 RepID=A0A0E0D6E4_9ORYZ